MGRPKLGAEYKKPSDYHYDYPEQREITRYLETKDRAWIISRSGYSAGYVRQWFRGKRRNAFIRELALKIQKLNLEKQRKLNS